MFNSRLLILGSVSFTVLLSILFGGTFRALGQAKPASDAISYIVDSKGVVTDLSKIAQMGADKRAEDVRQLNKIPPQKAQSHPRKKRC